MNEGQLHRAHEHRRPRDRSHSIGALLAGMADSTWFKRQQRLGHVVGALLELLPAELAAHLAVEGFRNGVLHLRADSAGHRYEMQLLKADLLTAMTAQLRGVFVRDIRIQLGATSDAGLADRLSASGDVHDEP